eukprot:CAMPEP_0174890236 /NCGR_PEP_ID=MMETSP0167-20121228/5409_1 /TAXON_ID=38298 /ORGANISM="Rhodella maculata, Strain CCMP736" /LENGTH=92 /DNA_ID=CAMNT_0016127975 /DNA_START=353 /DNA_END=631 /DNA_ORIENTATION=+
MKWSGEGDDELSGRGGSTNELRSGHRMIQDPVQMRRKISRIERKGRAGANPILIGFAPARPFLSVDPTTKGPSKRRPPRPDSNGVKARNSLG